MADEMTTRLMDPRFRELVAEYDAKTLATQIEQARKQKIEADLASIDRDKLCAKHSRYLDRRREKAKYYRDENDFVSHWGGRISERNFGDYLAFKRKRMVDPNYEEPLASSY
jgi:hypothetical protein